MDIVFITDNNYAFPTKIAIKSLIKNKNETTKYNIHIICVELNDENLKNLATLKTLDKNVSIDIIMKASIYADVQAYTYVSRSALYKFQLANIFDNLDKILYLDSDIIVEKDLSDLFDTDLENLYAAVVKDHFAHILNFDTQTGCDNYFNSGAMLLNLKKLREDDAPEKLIELKKNETVKCLMDQNVLNILFKDKTVILSPKYNLMLPNLINYSRLEIAEFYKISLDELNYIFENPTILHLTNVLKPWNNINAIKSDVFWKYADNIDILKFVEKMILENARLAEGKNIQTQANIEALRNELNSSNYNLINEINMLKTEIYDLKRNKKYPKWFCNLICCFIVKKKNRHHFREKYCRDFNCQKQPQQVIQIQQAAAPERRPEVMENPNIHLCKFNGIGQLEIAYIHECYWANIFRDTIQNSEWLLNKSFSPGRAALSYVSLYVLYRILNDIKPNNILECGLGQSSRMTIQYTDFYKKNLMIFEDNREWLDFFSLQFPTVKNYTHIYELDFINVDPIEKSRVYKGFEQDLNGKKFDLIIVDGPNGSTKYSRYQMVKFLDYIDPNNFIILLDDFNRTGEQETFTMAQQILASRNIEFISGSYSSDKSIGVLCSKNYKFALTF